MQIAMKVFISVIQQLNGFHVLAILDFKFILFGIGFEKDLPKDENVHGSYQLAFFN